MSVKNFGPASHVPGKCLFRERECGRSDKLWRWNAHRWHSFRDPPDRPNFYIFLYCPRSKRPTMKNRRMWEISGIVNGFGAIKNNISQHCYENKFMGCYIAFICITRIYTFESKYNDYTNNRRLYRYAPNRSFNSKMLISAGRSPEHNLSGT